MNSQEFLFLNVACVSLFGLWYWRSRGAASKKPTKLNMHAPDSAPLFVDKQTPAPMNEKSLNVIFNYNGHSWDAYEVFGLPAGSANSEVQKAYQLALKSCEPDSREFLETAYLAIVNRS